MMTELYNVLSAAASSKRRVYRRSSTIEQATIVPYMHCIR